MVTGKGGTGKTTLATALALALASGGKKTLLVEVEGRQGIAQIFGRAPLPYEERKVADTPQGGQVYALAVDAEAALLEYLEMFYGMRRAGMALTRFGAVDFATTIAPGVRDVLLTGKATEAVRRRSGDQRRGDQDGSRQPHIYDAVVLDAPPTGRIAQFLNVNAEVAGLARVGSIHNHAAKVMQTIRSPQTAVHFVTTLEEMPTQETLDGIDEVRAVGLNVGTVMINMVREPFFAPEVMASAAEGEIDTEALIQGLKATRMDHPERMARELAEEMTDHARRLRTESAVRERLSGIDHPRFEIPFVDDDIAPAALFALADLLRDQGAR